MASGWNLWVWLVSVVVRRYIIDILIIMITFPYSTCISSFFGSIIPISLFINPRRACAERVTVVVSCFCLYVCMYVCLSEHAILAVRAIRSITKDTIVLSVSFAAILRRRFS